jgi:hypothetical protein
LAPGVQEVVEDIVDDGDGESIDKEDTACSKAKDMQGVILKDTIHACGQADTALAAEVSKLGCNGVDEARRFEGTDAKGVDSGWYIEDQDGIVILRCIGKEAGMGVKENKGHDPLFLGFVKKHFRDKGVAGTRRNDTHLPIAPVQVGVVKKKLLESGFVRLSLLKKGVPEEKRIGESR